MCKIIQVSIYVYFDAVRRDVNKGELHNTLIQIYI